MIQPLNITLEAEDVTGQKRVRAKVRCDTPVRDFVQGVAGRMNLPRRDAGGNDITYHALLPREGRHLAETEILGDAARESDVVVLQPNIDAGGTAN